MAEEVTPEHTTHQDLKMNMKSKEIIYG